MVKSLRHSLALKLDSIGFAASTLCAIHCAAMPFIIIFLSLYGFQFIAHPIVEYLFIGSSVIIGIFTFSHGYINHHKRIYPFLLFTLGLLIIILGHGFFHNHSDLETVNSIDQNHIDSFYFFIAPVGAILIGLSHFINRKLSKTNKKCTC
ncbi:MAG: MerC domain-containing protein [Bacteroidota bacterium]|nr:MerC domain-containing protein [Bacteroidota bacterium]